MFIMCSSNPPGRLTPPPQPRPSLYPPFGTLAVARGCGPRKRYQRAKAFGLGLLVRKPSIVRPAVGWRPTGADLLGRSRSREGLACSRHLGDLDAQLLTLRRGQLVLEDPGLLGGCQLGHALVYPWPPLPGCGRRSSRSDRCSFFG